MVPINNHEDDGRSSSSSTCLPDGTNPYCWLATMPAPPLDEFGLRMKNTTTKSASLVHLAASVQNSEFALECISCSSPGIEELGHVLKTDEGIRESTNLVNHTLNKLVHMMEGVFMQVQIDRILKKADVGGRCSHVLAIIIVIFSGLWPYVKQLLVLFMWLLPPRMASIRFRGKMFYWLDALGRCWNEARSFRLDSDEDYSVINHGDSHELYQPALRNRNTSTSALRCIRPFWTCRILEYNWRLGWTYFPFASYDCFNMFCCSQPTRLCENVISI
jgi:hypothetical protein